VQIREEKQQAVEEKMKEEIKKVEEEKKAKATVIDLEQQVRGIYVCWVLVLLHILLDNLVVTYSRNYYCRYGVQVIRCGLRWQESNGRIRFMRRERRT
jgi:hypothetical protein